VSVSVKSGAGRIAGSAGRVVNGEAGFGAGSWPAAGPPLRRLAVTSATPRDPSVGRIVF